MRCFIQFLDFLSSFYQKTWVVFTDPLKPNIQFPPLCVFEIFEMCTLEGKVRGQLRSTTSLCLVHRQISFRSQGPLVWCPLCLTRPFSPVKKREHHTRGPHNRRLTQTQTSSTPQLPSYLTYNCYMWRIVKYCFDSECCQLQYIQGIN